MIGKLNIINKIKKSKRKLKKIKTLYCVSRVVLNFFEEIQLDRKGEKLNDEMRKNSWFTIK